MAYVRAVVAEFSLWYVSSVSVHVADVRVSETQ